MNRREHGAALLVAGLSAAFGAALLQGTGVIAAAAHADAATGGSAVVGILLGTVSWVFILIALYAGAVVTVNTFTVIVAGRVRRIALHRLLGATARAERRAVAREGLVAGAIGAAVGVVVGSALVVALVAVLRTLGVLGAFPWSFLDPQVLLPGGAVVVTTWLAAIVGSRRVLTVTPVEALGGAEEQNAEEARASRLRSVGALALIVLGALLLAGGVALGLVSNDGLPVAFFGGLISFTGIAVGAHLVIPRALAVTGRLLGRSPVARLAAANALRYPVRSTRSTVGLLVAVTLITMFGTALRTFGGMVETAAGDDPGYYAGIETMLSTTTLVFGVLTGFSAVIAGVGLVNALSLGVLQRTRELGLLRALGFTAAQLRRMVLAEAGQLVLTATALGLLLGTVYGWAGAHALLGAIRGMPGPAYLAVPWALVGVVAAGAVLLTLVASAVPARRATAVAPIAALAAE